MLMIPEKNYFVACIPKDKSIKKILVKECRSLAECEDFLIGVALKHGIDYAKIKDRVSNSIIRTYTEKDFD